MAQTGPEYLAGLNDGRRVIYAGEEVADVSQHPAFTGVAHTIADLYDHLDDAGPVEVDGAKTHPFWAVPKTREDLRAQRDGILAWQRRTLGFVGRTPDTLACLLTSIAAEQEFFGDAAANAVRAHREGARQLTHYAQALTNPPIDRALPVEANADVMLHIVEERDDAIVVSGAKAVVTGAATAQRIFVSHFGQDVESAPFALTFTVPVNAPGLTLYARRAYIAGEAADTPLAHRFEENDCLLVFDRVEIPREDVLLTDPELMAQFNSPRLGWNTRLAFQAACRLQVKLETIAALAHRAVEVAGSGEFRGVQAVLGELVAFRHTVAAYRDAMIEQATETDGGIRPGFEAAMAFEAMAPDAYSRMRISLQTVLASGLAHLPGNPERVAEDPALQQFLRGSGDTTALERATVYTLLWDAIGSEFGSREELYERSYWGQAERTHLGLRAHAAGTGLFADWNEPVATLFG